MPPILSLLGSALRGVLDAANSVALALFGPGSRLPRPAPYPPETHRRDITVEVVRPDDLLVLTLDFYNFRITPPAGATPPRLELVGTGHGFIVVRMPPQSFGERAFFEATAGLGVNKSEPLDPPPVSARISGPTELVFRVPETLLPLEFSLSDILELLTRCEPVVQPTLRRPVETPQLNEQVVFGGPRTKFSAIEAPYRLVLSPSLESRWHHALQPVTDAAGGRTELWHTRLTPGTTAGVVWSPDYAGQVPGPPPGDAPFLMSLKRDSRHRIVRSSSDPKVRGAAHVDVHQLMLSSQGAWLSVRGGWDAGLTGLDLPEWRHVMTGGRDQYARVVEEGNLFCLGHRAVLVIITERKVETEHAGRRQESSPVAYLRQIKKIFLRESTRTYAHRQMPFRSVTIQTLVTPNLDDPGESKILEGKAADAFWPKVAGEHFLFHVVATDWEGREIEFEMPLAFVVGSIANQAPTPDADLTHIIEVYNGLPDTDFLRDRPLSGQNVAYAPPREPGDTSLDTFSHVFGASGARNGSPRFLPMMTQAHVDVPPARVLSGDPAPSTIALDPGYLAGAGPAIGNMGEVFAYLVESRTPVRFSSDRTGGVVAPHFDISGISRAYGPVGGDIEKFAAGTFSPADIFKGVKLLGGIDLGSILAGAINATPELAGIRIPRLRSIRRTVPGTNKEVLETSYRWNVDESFLVPTAGMFVRKPGAEFLLEAVVQTPLDGSEPVFEVNGRITHFAVVLLPPPEGKSKPEPLVGINFERVEFRAAASEKVDFGVVFQGFEFLGPLAFVNKLREVIPMDGFDDPPYLNVILPPAPMPGVNVGFTQGIPTVGIGIFTLQNIGFSAGFYLPFLGGEANLRLAFCERHQPFILTVSLFGGGGFFAIDIGFGGVRMLEAALEFGAAVALNLGVARGAASVMGGVYYQKSGAEFALSAYFRAAGALSVLGIITVSVELYVSLNFQSNKGLPHGGKLWGQASLTVKIKIAFFSKSVQIAIEREFAGSDPKFIDTVEKEDWARYCAAFAPYPA